MRVVHGLDGHFVVGAIDVGFLDEILERFDELFKDFSLGETCLEHGCCCVVLIMDGIVEMLVGADRRCYVLCEMDLDYLSFIVWCSYLLPCVVLRWILVHVVTRVSRHFGAPSTSRLSLSRNGGNSVFKEVTKDMAGTFRERFGGMERPHFKSNPAHHHRLFAL